MGEGLDDHGEGVVVGGAEGRLRRGSFRTARVGYMRGSKMSLAGWLYRGGRPNRVARVADRCMAAIGAFGVTPGYLITLEVQGRRSGRAVRLPLVMVVVAGRREEVRLEEVAPDRRAPVLKAYLKRAPGARPHLPVDKDAPLAEFEQVSSLFPVFRISPK